jgi:hypothetical protein
VAVFGTNFLAESRLACSFGSVAATAAVFKTSTLVFCTAPAQAAGAVALEIANNGQQFTGDGVQFTYLGAAGWWVDRARPY